MMNEKTGRPRKYHFSEMEVGDGEFYAAGDKTLVRLQSMLLESAAYQVGRRGQFATRRVNKGGEIGIKIVRVAA